MHASIKPLDADLILAQAKATGRIITVEENVLQGGFGSAVLELLQDNSMSQVKVKRLGIPDQYIEQGTQAQLRKDVGIDAEGIVAAVQGVSEELKGLIACVFRGV